MMNKEDSFLGIGWSFPPAFDKASGEVRMLKGEEDIKSSLEVLLSTRPGERIMQPLFGCNLDIMMFESLDTTLKTEMRDLIQKAILYFEPRIDVEKIELETQDEQNELIHITIIYTVRSTNTRGNLVYPFYLTEI